MAATLPVAQLLPNTTQPRHPSHHRRNEPDYLLTRQQQACSRTVTGETGQRRRTRQTVTLRQARTLATKAGYRRARATLRLPAAATAAAPQAQPDPRPNPARAGAPLHTSYCTPTSKPQHTAPHAGSSQRTPRNWPSVSTSVSTSLLPRTGSDTSREGAFWLAAAADEQGSLGSGAACSRGWLSLQALPSMWRRVPKGTGFAQATLLTQACSRSRLYSEGRPMCRTLVSRCAEL